VHAKDDSHFEHDDSQQSGVTNELNKML